MVTGARDSCSHCIHNHFIHNLKAYEWLCWSHFHLFEAPSPGDVTTHTVGRLSHPRLPSLDTLPQTRLKFVSMVTLQLIKVAIKINHRSCIFKEFKRELFQSWQDIKKWIFQILNNLHYFCYQWTVLKYCKNTFARSMKK